MLDGINDGPEEEAPAQADAPASEETPEQKNNAFIKEGVMTVQIYLEGSPSSFACAIGSLDLAKDLVKNYFGRKGMAEAAIKARATSKIIIPGLS